MTVKAIFGPMRPYQRLLLTVCTAVLVGSSLSACFPLVLGGAAAGALVAIDRRTSGAQLEDEGIELRAMARLRDNIGSRARVSVTSYNRQVLLTGEVINSPTLVQRSSDVLITGQVKALLIDSRDIYANAFKVVTERGTVYLMGRVTQREADRATEIVRGARGVQKVVRILEIISEDELRSLVPQPAKPATATRPAGSGG